MDVEFIGPFFDQAAWDAATTTLRDGVQAAVSDSAYQLWLDNLEGSLKNPTGYYQGEINVRHEDRQDVVNDQAVIYGWWLEGIGRRNAPVTRFEGYQSRDRAVDTLTGQIGDLAAPAVGQFVKEIGG